MEFKTAICRQQHEEHMAVLGLLERLRGVIDEFGASVPPPADHPATRNLLDALGGPFKADIFCHFHFEDDRLFPLHAEAQGAEITDMLGAEHKIILPLIENLVAVAKSARDDGFTDKRWIEFRRLGLVVAVELAAHAEKEENALLPALDEHLSGDVDASLHREYADRKAAL